jgi:hypothetical protein
VLFYLGTHRPDWLARPDVAVPLFVSRRRLAPYKTLPRAVTRWALDSGGFTELTMFGSWQTTSREYVAQVRRFATEVGRMDYAAPQDWMCEPAILRQTGLDVAEHQARTVSNYVDLRHRAPDVPWLPVVQGWTLDDYLRCLDLYGRAGVDLAAAPVVGIGTVCRRQASAEAARIIDRLADEGLRLHGFGLKLGGLGATAGRLAAADSMAWSFAARRADPLPGCAHKNCANCRRYALLWRERVLRVIARGEAAPRQLSFAA